MEALESLAVAPHLPPALAAAYTRDADRLRTRLTRAGVLPDTAALAAAMARRAAAGQRPPL